MRWTALGILIPEAALPLLVVLAGLLLVLGFRRAALGLFAFAVLTPILAPLAEALLSELPPWLSLAILLAVGLALLRGLAALFLGARAADHMVGEIAAHCVLACLRLPFRAVGWVSRVVANGTGINR